jgi:hypothetical protein
MRCIRDVKRSFLSDDLTWLVFEDSLELAYLVEVVGAELGRTPLWFL